jgi:hypothetical protein
MGPQMKRRTAWNPWLATLAFAVLGCSVFTAASDDESSIRELQTLQADAWNHHDGTAYAALFAADGDCVNALGWWWKSRAEIQKQLTAAFAFVFHESQLTLSGRLSRNTLGTRDRINDSRHFTTAK